MHNRPRAAILWIIITASPWPTTAMATVTPLAYRNQHPLYLQLPSLTPMPVAALRKGTGQFVLTNSYSNIFEQFVSATHDVRIDLELLRTSLQVGYGIGHGLTIDADLPVHHTGGGVLDPMIQAYHNAFGFPNAGRDRFPDNDFALRIIDQATGATVYQDDPVGIGLGDISIRLRHETLPEGRYRPAIGWFFQLELPTGSRSKGLGNGNLDHAIGLLTEKHWGKRWYTFLNLAYARGNAIRGLEALMREEQINWVTGGAFRLSRRADIHAMAQLHGGSSLLKATGNSRWDSFPLDLIIGFSGDHPFTYGREHFFWQVGFSEDLNANGPSIDFTALIQTGIRWHALSRHP